VKHFYNKVEALIESKKSNQPCQWVYNDDTLLKFDWLTTPTISLKEVYKRRAQQLREKYDYIVLNYSGGADSHNILHSFLDNNLKIDELLIRWPHNRIKNIYTPSTNKNAGNHLSEWELTLLPDLQWIRRTHPEIKIEFYDYSDETMDIFNGQEVDNDPWYKKITGAHFSPGHVVRWKLLDRYKRMFLDKGIRGCNLYGVDKPKLIYENNSFYVFYSDTIAGTVLHFDDYDDYYNPTELFYWTPDMPDVVKVQAHHIMNCVKKDIKLLDILLPGVTNTYMLRNVYENAVRNIIYPYWDQTRFQAYKPSSLYRCEIDDWMYSSDNHDQHVMDTWQYSLDYLEKNIDPKYFIKTAGGNVDGLISINSPYFKIGELKLS
jgi:hypothetical protein